ncbi:phage portal protein [Romboutsia sedimentorum]|uniref:phage portal protein n=1 Tax=Romboutsia sedimentorum TaxID=1368474 RepID=UPI0024DED398|nr:phage portal protein [Romboutsia sedimentorum]MDK2587482.1 phage portal protein [Romboutsia sedimentorum]
MGLLGDFFKQSSVNSVDVDLTNGTVTETDGITFSSIKEADAKKIVALNSGINLIGNSISTLPIYLYKRDKKGERIKVDDYRNYLLNASPNNTTTAMNLKYNIVKNLILKGNGYIYIKKDNLGTINRLEYIDYNDMNVEKVKYNDGTIGYEYKFKDNSEMDIVAQHYEVINLIKDNKDSGSYQGTGILETGQELINIAKEESRFSLTSLVGVNIKGFLYSASKLSDAAKKNLKESWKKFYTGSDKTATPLLEEGLEFKQLNLKPAEIELIKSKEFTIKQIASLLNIPFSYLVDSASSYNNSSEEALRFLTVTLNPYIRLIEENFNKYLLTEIEKQQGYFFEFKAEELLRMTIKEQMEYFDTAVKGGLITRAEARRKLNYPYLEGTDILQIPSNMMILKDGVIRLVSNESVDNNLVTQNTKGGE